MTDTFLNSKNIKRYSEVYLDKEQEINNFDPVLYIEIFKDYYRQKNGLFYICNRQLVCECTTECFCDDDDFTQVEIKCDMASNCKCNMDIILKSKYKLNPKMEWNIFIIDEDDNDISIITINPKENTITFKLPSYELYTTFTPEDHIKQNRQHGFISTQFNYMDFVQLSHSSGIP
jgi:hypothetical protein